MFVMPTHVHFRIEELRSMRLWRTNPLLDITITHGEGCMVWDSGGKAYLDMLSGTWCNVLGYGHPQWIHAIRDQVSKITHTGASFRTIEIDAALSKLKEMLPPQLNRGVFLNTGSEAVELALKMAHAATGGDGIVVVERGYYGATTYAFALSEAGRTARYQPSPGNICRLPAPDCRSCPTGRSRSCDGEFTCLETLADLAQKGAPCIAAVLYEPVMTGGIIAPPIGYGARLRALTSRCNALFIAEEVTTGMGRTGRWFGFEHENIVPDILVIGKAIGAGLPISAVVTTDDVEARCGGLLSHIQSHQNDPFSGRMAATVISILQEEHLVELAAERGRQLLAGLKELQASHPSILDVRGRGLMVGVNLHPDWSCKGMEMSRRLLEAGFIVDYHIPTATFRLFPPYVISSEQIDSFLQASEKVIIQK